MHRVPCTNLALPGGTGGDSETSTAMAPRSQERRGSPVPEELPEREIRLRRFAEQSKLIPQAHRGAALWCG